MTEKLPIPVVETIQKRRSVRTFADRPLTPADREKLAGSISQVTNPFGVKVSIHMIDKPIEAGGEKLGTYGVIKGASTFLGVSAPRQENALLAAGYTFENLILCATAMGLGTVWLAATFSRGHFASAMGIGPGEWFPAICPVGYPAQKQSLRETLMRTAMKSAARKPWQELFFQERFGTPLTQQEAGPYVLCLEMLRLAPSATNAQPWRVVKQGNFWHFYETHGAHVSADEAAIKQVDLGIALAHFHQTALEQGLAGQFVTLPQAHPAAPENTHYLISWCEGQAV